MMKLSLIAVGLLNAASRVAFALPADISVNGWVPAPSDGDNGVSVVGWSHVGTTINLMPQITTFTYQDTVNGAAVMKTATVTLLDEDHNVVTATPDATATPATVASSGSSTSTSRRTGAIAGGVLGALAVAGFAIFLLRYRNKKSSVHWRNRGVEKGQWNDDVKQSVSPVFMGAPVATTKAVTSPIESPLGAPIFIRAPHRPSPSEQFADPHSAFRGGNPRSHARTSSCSSITAKSHEK